MPSKHISGNYKQKNKPFKGASNKGKHKHMGKIQTDNRGGLNNNPVTKKINKKVVTNSEKKNTQDQIKKNKMNSQDIKMQKDLVLNQIFESDTKEKVLNTLKNIKPPKIIALIPFNENANAFNIKQGLETYITNLQAQNEEIDMDQQQQQQQMNDKLNFKFPYFQFFANPKTMQGLVQQNFIFTACDRNLQNALDLCKVADIICPILSCQNCNIDQTNLDPYGQAGAFDDFAYRFMSCLRIQGLPPTVCLLQDLEKFSVDKRPKVKKLFSRFFAGEFSDSMCSLEDESSIIPYLRKLQTTPLQLIDWRDNRGYVLADQVAYDQKSQLLEVTGFLKGNYLNANQLMHVTGYDDYQIERIEVLKNPYKLRLKSKKQSKTDLLAQQKRKMTGKSMMADESIMEENNLNNTTINASNVLDLQKDILMTQEAESDKQEPLQRIIKKDLNNFVIKDGNILNAIDDGDDEEQKQDEEMGGLDDEQNEQQQSQNPDDIIENLIKKEKQIKKQQQKAQEALDKQKQKEEGGDMEEEGSGMEDDMEGDDDGSDVSFDEDDVAQDVQHKKQYSMQMRDEEDLQEDEVEYDTNVQVRERYGKYQAIKSFKTTEWDPYENLPDPYEQIYTFKHFSKTKKLALQQAQENAFVYAGFYVKIYLKNFPVQLLQGHNPSTPFILSGLLRHERKMTQLHLKVKKNPEYENGTFFSKKDLEIHLGFKRFVTQPVFSRVFANNAKTKYVKKFHDNQQYVASFYHPCTYGGNVLAFDNNENKQSAVYGLSGEIFKNDPLHVILKRIVFTGYPHKINKRKAVVKFMFYNVDDIRYFKPVELKTNLHQRGHIVEPLGTHGLMKCQFNNGIKQHDVITIQLYKRVYPKNLAFMNE